MADHDAFLLRAIELSREHSLRGEGGPFGAVVVREGKVLAEGWNQVVSTADPTAHAEVVAIRRACAAVGDFALRGATIYASCEPCPMCLGAIHWARIDALHYAATRADAATLGFDDSLLYDEVARPPAERRLVTVHAKRELAQDAMLAWHRSAARTVY